MDLGTVHLFHKETIGFTGSVELRERRANQRVTVKQKALTHGDDVVRHSNSYGVHISRRWLVYEYVALGS